MAVELAVTAGPNAGHSFRFAEHASFIVGRSPHAHFILPDSDPYVSRYQFLVEVNPPFVRIRDMGSRSGTWINGTKTEQADLRDGDSIKIGVTTLRVRIESPTPSAEPPAQGPAHTLDLPGEAVETVSKTIATSPGEVPSLGLTSLLRPTPTPAGYELGRELGRGGMGVVYEATHLATGRKVAIKSILPQIAASETTLKKFLREAEIVRQLDHPHVVMYVDSGEIEGTIWYAMEYVSGEDASRVADRELRLAVGRACRIAVQLLNGLAYAHAKGFVHRDVKPSNVLLATVDGKEHTKLADFGLARAYEASSLSGLTMTGVAGGTPHFMPPEQVKDMRSAKPPADIFSAGATLYRLLAGAYPYPPAAKIEQLLRQILDSEPTPIAAHRIELPTPLCAAIHRSMARNPMDRFPDATAFAKAIAPFADD